MIKDIGMLNGHSVGIIMKELVRRAIVTIRNQQLVFEVSAKRGHSGQMDDMVTSADKAAQKVYVRSLSECFQVCGIIAEEDSLAVPCSINSGLYFTVDPLDGTKAFVRRQSHGVGTMISLSENNVFLAAYVGDVNTQEIYGFRPGSLNVHRITEFNVSEILVANTKPLKTRYALLRDPERFYSPLSQNLLKTGFKNEIVEGGSIGIWLARLWKGEVGAALLPPSAETPWDANPVNAISQKLGFVHLRPSPDEKKWMEEKVMPTKIGFKRDHDTLIVHKDNLAEIVWRQP